MQRVDGSIIKQSPTDTSEDFLFAYSEEEKQQHEIDAANAKLVFQNRYTVLHDDLFTKLGLAGNEAIVYAFIHSYLNTTDHFYFSNAALAKKFNISERTVTTILLNLQAKHLLKLSYRRRSNGGQLRYISIPKRNNCEYQLEKTASSNSQNLLGSNNKISNNKINTLVSSELRELIAFWNTSYGTNYKPISSLQGNFNHWLQTYQLAEIKQAITNIRRDPFWRDKMTPTILFRQKNARGEPVNFIERLLAVKSEKPSTLGLENEFVIYKKRKEDSASRQ